MTDTTGAAFAELTGTAVVRVAGADARAFLHAQLTSDIAGLSPLRTQYAGYCSPKGRLLATFLVWSLEDALLLQLPRTLAEDIRARLAKYVLRSKVTLEATPGYVCFAVYGGTAAAALGPLASVPAGAHEITTQAATSTARLPGGRFLVLVEAADAPAFSTTLAGRAREETETAWERLDIEHGIPVITPATQDRYVPQMVNLDLIGGVSYSKGCYPGQEIVARMHYLGRVKQRMYPVHAPDALETGDPLYSTAFGAGQASGSIVNASPDPAGGCAALAVIQTAAVANDDVHWKSIDGPALELKVPPYSIPS